LAGPVHISLRRHHGGFTPGGDHLLTGDVARLHEGEIMKHRIQSFAAASRLKGLAAVMLLAVSAAAIQPALAHGGHHGPRHGHGGPAAMAFAGSPERVDRMVDRLLRGLDATEAQRTQIKQIAQAAASDLKSRHEAGRSLRERAMQLFTQPTVDANAVEALRQERMAHMDQVSRRMSQAMLEISQVLTPEQRAKLAERMHKRGPRGERRPGGEQGPRAPR
jgi:protein CpxP